MQSENAKKCNHKIQVQNKCKKKKANKKGFNFFENCKKPRYNAKKMQKQCEKNAKNTKKKCKTNAKKIQKKTNANCMFFAFFGGGFVRASNFSKIAKILGKMQKKAKQMQKKSKHMQQTMQKNAKKNTKTMQILEMSMIYKNKFPEVAFFFAFLLAFFLHDFCIFLGQVKVFGVALSGCIFLHVFCIYIIKFYNL